MTRDLMPRFVAFVIWAALIWALTLHVLAAPAPCPGVVLARGELTALDHEAIDGYATIGALTVVVPARGVPADLLRVHRGQRVELVLRRVPALERITR